MWHNPICQFDLRSNDTPLMRGRYPPYAWKTARNTPLMRAEIPHLCVENAPGCLLFLNIEEIHSGGVKGTNSTEAFALLRLHAVLLFLYTVAVGAARHKKPLHSEERSNIPAARSSRALRSLCQVRIRVRPRTCPRMATADIRSLSFSRVVTIFASLPKVSGSTNRRAWSFRPRRGPRLMSLCTGAVLRKVSRRKQPGADEPVRWVRRSGD